MRPFLTDFGRRTVLENLRNLPHAPGAQMQNVPTRPISKEIGMKNGELSDPEDEVEARLKSTSYPSFTTRLMLTNRTELVRRRAMNGTYSPPTSDDDEEDDVYSRRMRQGGSRRLPFRHPRRRRPDTPSSSLDDDPCGVRRKRTFFKAAGDPTASMSKVLGLSAPLNGVKGNGVVDGLNGLNVLVGLENGLNGVTPLEADILENGDLMRVDEPRTEAVSRAGSPESVV